jgi:hypothetical protein
MAKDKPLLRDVVLKQNIKLFPIHLVNLYGSEIFFRKSVSKLETPLKLFCDNQAAIHIVANPGLHEHKAYRSRLTLCP